MKGEGRKGKGGEKALLALFGRLPPRQQDKLMSFAELLAREAPPGRRRPAPGARPAGETVTMAIRRLARGYPMLDRRRLMPEASDLMAQHALHGRPAAKVIDELEAMFEKHYRQSKAEGGRRKAEG